MAAVTKPLNAQRAVYLQQLQETLKTAPHGTKADIVARAAVELGVSVPTVHRQLSECLGRVTGRKRRTDAGVREVSDADLQAISAALVATFRKTGNRIMSFDTAVDMLRDNGVITTQLSASRLATVLTERGLHPSQLTRPEPSIEQRSLHPNHVWQVDASVCVAYYLSNATGLQVMDEKKFYKNKPGNVTRVQAERLIRYAIADHYEHEILTRYYLGSECAAHLTEFLIWAMAPKAGHIVHGVPFICQMDMGSANTSAMTQNLLKQLAVRVIVHERHNSRANGSVEKAHHIVEREFESGLAFQHVRDLADLNDKALIWANHFGATKIHTRYGKPRHALWMTIAPEQLRLAPDVDLMRELVTTHPENRRVTNDLDISFKVKGFAKCRYDVRHLPGVMAGQNVPVIVNAYRAPAVQVGYTDAESGEICWLTVEPVAMGEDGRRADAPVIGEHLRQAPRGLLEHNRDAVMQLAYGGATAEEAEQAKEKGALAFGGRVDPFKRAAEAQLPAYLPRRGTPLPAEARTVEVPRLNAVQVAGRLREHLGDRYSPTWFAQISARCGDAGLPEDQVEAFAEELAGTQAPAEASNVLPLRAVGGA